MTTTHPVSPEEVMAFFDGELDAARAADVATHIQSCATCQQIGHELDTVGKKLDGWAVPPAPGSFIAPATPAQPWFGPMAKLGLIAAACVVVVLAASQGAWWHTSEEHGGGAYGGGRRGGRGAAPVDGNTLAMKAVPFGATLSHEDIERFGETWFQQPRDSRFQVPGVSVLIQIFLDWLCQACTAYNKSYSEVVARYEQEQPGAVQYVLKDFPWNTDCNPQAANLPGHEASCVAALGVRIARDSGQEKTLIAWFADNYQQLRQMTPEHKIDAIKRETQRVTAVADFDAAAARFQADLEHDIADGIAAGIKATPTVFINGVRVPDKGQLPPEYFDAAIALELKRKQ